MPFYLPTYYLVWASLLFLGKHFVADFVLQTRWIVEGKENREGWLAPLTVHAGIHALATLLIFLALAPDIAWMALVDFAIHFCVDRWKAIVARRLDTTPQRKSFWLLFGIDQTLHHLTDLGFVLAIAVARAAG